MGITEKTDAIGVVCSEERGEISVVCKGEIFKAENLIHLHYLLRTAFKNKLAKSKKKPKPQADSLSVPAVGAVPGGTGFSGSPKTFRE